MPNRLNSNLSGFHFHFTKLQRTLILRVENNTNWRNYTTRVSAFKIGEMEVQPFIFLGIKIKPGPIERFKLENYNLDNTVDNLKIEVEKKTNLPPLSIELIHHGKILKGKTTLQASGVKSGEMVHVLRRHHQLMEALTPRYSDAELQQLNNSLRTLGCTPNAPGWTRAMQLLNEEPVISEIIDLVPSLGEDCVALSILHEVELLAALGANVQTMRAGANAHHELPVALRHLTRLVRSRANTTPTNDNVPTSGFAYSLEALSEDEDADEEESEDTERSPITQEQLAAALQQAATEAVSATASGSGSARRVASQDSLLRLLRAAPDSSRASPASGGSRGSTLPSLITPEMFSEAITEAMSRATARNPAGPGTPMQQGTRASSSHSLREEDFSSQIIHMREMGLLDDALNVRALLICAGDVNAAINLVFSGAIGDD